MVPADQRAPLCSCLFLPGQPLGSLGPVTMFASCSTSTKALALGSPTTYCVGRICLGPSPALWDLGQQGQCNYASGPAVCCVG